MLAACIGADSTYSELLDKRKTAHLCNNLNYRNRMAQYAGRASVNLNTHLFFRGVTQQEDGYILFVRKNALQILIPKFGLEGTIYLCGKDGAAHKSGVQFIFNEEDNTQRHKEIAFHAFDPVVIRLSLDSSNVQREKMVFELVKPYISGFSVEPMEVDISTDGAKELANVKRKATPCKKYATETIDLCTPTKDKSKKGKKSKK